MDIRHLSRAIILLVGLSAGITFAQTIPNGDFETWAGGNPTGWTVSNTPPTLSTVTQSTDAHGGSSAARGAVTSFNGFAIAPSITGPGKDGFPVGSRVAALHGWYKFTPVGGDGFSVIVALKNAGAGIGAGSFITTSVTAVYRELVANVTYISPATPDSGVITITTTAGGGVYHIGTVLILDDLTWGPATSVEQTPTGLPSTFFLEQNYPNPFNPTTWISYSIGSGVSGLGAGWVKLAVYDILGREVATLVNEELSPGRYRATLDGTSLSSGTYFYRLQAGNFVATKKLVLVR